MSTSSGITVVIKDDDRKVPGKPIDIEHSNSHYGCSSQHFRVYVGGI
jgi:hypothetical protein